MLFLAEVLTKTSEIVYRGGISLGLRVQGGHSAVGKCLPQHLLRFHQMQHSISDTPSWMGPSPSNGPAKPHEAANGSARVKRLLHSTPEPIWANTDNLQLYPLKFCKIKLHFVWRTTTRCAAQHHLIPVLSAMVYSTFTCFEVLDCFLVGHSGIDLFEFIRTCMPPYVMLMNDSKF